MLELQVHRYTDVPDWLDLKAYVDEAAFTIPTMGRTTSAATWTRCFRRRGRHRVRILPARPAAQTSARLVAAPVHPAAQPRVLRGYSWLTVLPENLAAKLGGTGALRGSGAFAEVRTLGGGGAWLLAIADYREFTDEALVRVARTLGPAFHPGPLTKWPPRRGDPPLRIVVRPCGPASAQRGRRAATVTGRDQRGGRHLSG